MDDLAGRDYGNGMAQDRLQTARKDMYGCPDQHCREMLL